jgi:hypothetical protein
LPGTGVPALHILEFLDQADRDVACFCEGVLLTKADTRTAVEGEIFPSRPECLPPLRLVLVCIEAVKVAPAMHDVW